MSIYITIIISVWFNFPFLSNYSLHSTLKIWIPLNLIEAWTVRYHSQQIWPILFSGTFIQTTYRINQDGANFFWFVRTMEILFVNFFNFRKLVDPHFERFSTKMLKNGNLWTPPKSTSILCTPSKISKLVCTLRRSENYLFDLFNLPHLGKYVVRFGWPPEKNENSIFKLEPARKSPSICCSTLYKSKFKLSAK